MLKETQKQELKPVASYISGLPPVEWRSQISSEMLGSILGYWYWLGQGLNAYFSDEPNPINSADFSENLKNQLRNSVSSYISLSGLFFEAEHLLRKEAETQGIPLVGLRRSDFLRIWAQEECLYQVSLQQQYHWESLNKKQNEERQREIIKYFENEISGETLEFLKNRWVKEDAKLAQELEADKLMPFTTFCLQVFQKYRRQLPKALEFIKSKYKDIDFQKMSVINGVPVVNPGRGKDKGKRRAKFS